MRNVAYFMVSLDDVEKNRAFARSVDASFVLLSDPGKQNAKRFGVLALGGLYAKRITFYMDAKGVVRYIDDDVEPSTHGADIVLKLQELGIGRGVSSPNS